MDNVVARGIIRLLDWIYDRFVPSLFPREVVRYLICGVGNYIVFDAVLYFVIYHYVIAKAYVDVAVIDLFISPHVAALILTFPITFLTGFWLNRNVAFRSTERAVSSQIVRYAMTVMGSILLSYLSLKVFVEYFDIWATPAKVLSSIVTSLYSYLVARFYTFRR